MFHILRYLQSVHFDNYSTLISCDCMIAVFCMWAASIYALMSDDFVHKTSILMIYCTCFANVWMFDISDTDRLINNFDIRSFDMLISLLKLIFSDVFVLRLRFWMSVSSKHDSFLLYFHLLIIISSWLSASIQSCTSLAWSSDISFQSSCWRYWFSDCVSLSCIIFHSSWYFWLQIYALIYLFALIELSRCISLKSSEQYCYLFVF